MNLKVTPGGLLDIRTGRKCQSKAKSNTLRQHWRSGPQLAADPTSRRVGVSSEERARRSSLSSNLCTKTQMIPVGCVDENISVRTKWRCQEQFYAAQDYVFAVSIKTSHSEIKGMHTLENKRPQTWLLPSVIIVDTGIKIRAWKWSDCSCLTVMGK